jgi:hypothetical protein
MAWLVGSCNVLRVVLLWLRSVVGCVQLLAHCGYALCVIINWLLLVR